MFSIKKTAGLLDYFWKTYTDEHGMNLDNFIGNGAITIACIKNNRRSIGLEINSVFLVKFYDIIAKIEQLN